MASTAASSAASTSSTALSNPRGIPKADFLVRSRQCAFSLARSQPRGLTCRAHGISQEDVEQFIGGPDADAEAPLQSLQQLLSFVVSL